MKSTAGRLVLALLVTIPMVGAAPAQAAAPGTLTAVDIHPPGWMSSSAGDVNNRGEVIITATNTVNSEIQPPLAFVWRNGRHTALRPLPGGTGTLAQDINERGVAVGFCQAVAVVARPCLWRQGRPVDIGTADPRDTGSAFAVNDRGEVVGDVQIVSRGNANRAFIWRRGVLTDLGGSGQRGAIGINNRGQVIGAVYTDEGNRGFLWERGVLTDLGTLGGASSLPTDINERGQIVGTSTTADGVEHAFLWQNGRMIDIGPSSVRSSAQAINDRGQVIGYEITETWDIRSFRWHRGVTTPLDAYLGDINERGWIGATTTTDSRHAVQIRNNRTLVADGSGAAVLAINDQGLMAGWTRLPAPTDHATVWR